MEAKGQFTIVIRGSTERTSKIPVSSWHGFDYLMQRLLAGQHVAMTEFDHYGLDVVVGPAALLEHAADFLDDGYHERLVTELRDIAATDGLEEWPPKDDWPDPPLPIAMSGKSAG